MSTKESKDKDIPAMFMEFVECTKGEGYRDWAHYKELKSSFYCVAKSVRWPSYYVCNCPEGIKKRPCKHSVYVMTRMGLDVYPPDAKADPLEPKRKRGRPRKAKGGQALVVDDNVHS